MIRSRGSRSPARDRGGHPAFGPGWFLYLIAGVAGAAVLVVEILGARMLAPYFGTSHFVWTAQIIVTLVALALGYDIGGKLADPVPRPRTLDLALLGAACYLAVVAHTVAPVAWWCTRLDLATGTLAASAFLFFVPLVLLATVGPFLSRVMVTDLRSVGGRVGRLLAVGTMGSVFGAAVVGYVLVPLVAYSTALTLTAAALAGLAGASALCRGRGERKVAGAALALGLAAVALAVGSPTVRRLPENLVERHVEETPYGRIQVIDTEDGTRWLLTDFLRQNAYDIGSRRSVSAYTHVLAGLALGARPAMTDALCIGMGIGVVPTALVRAGVSVEVVEINPAIPRVAARWFDLPADQFTIRLEDGRRFLHRTGRRYDAVILDAFSGDSSPEHLMTREAFAAMRDRLRPEGILLINAFADHRPGLDYMAASLARTLRVVFGHVRIRTTGAGNMFYEASDGALPEPVDPVLTDVPASCREAVRRGLGEPVTVNASVGDILTDDRNPAAYHDGAMREHFRRQFIELMRPD